MSFMRKLCATQRRPTRVGAPFEGRGGAGSPVGDPQRGRGWAWREPPEPAEAADGWPREGRRWRARDGWLPPLAEDDLDDLMQLGGQVLLTDGHLPLAVHHRVDETVRT